MAKAKYTKVEEAIDKGIHDMKVEQLLRETDKESQVPKDALTPVHMILIITQHLKWMKKNDKEVYKKCKVKKQQVQELADLIQTHKNKLRPEELEKLKTLYQKVIDYKNKTYPPEKNEEQVENEKGKHIYKRHNINENWLPLDVPPI